MFAIKESFDAFRSYSLPLIRRIFPQLLSANLVGVQVMSGPVTIAYAQRFVAFTIADFDCLV